MESCKGPIIIDYSVIQGKRFCVEKLVFPVVSQDNGNLAFYRGQVFSMVCLLPLTTRFKLQLGERNASFL